MLVLGIIYLQVIIGGTTRLTESGLSITRWELVSGSLPPMSSAAWDAAFDLYKATPQYQKMNKGMSLSDFKFIYFWEWLHRFWGRIGFLVLLGIFVYFSVSQKRSELSTPSGGGIPFYYRRFGILLFLYALQGLLGWFMVKSGLSDMPRVSHYRLTAHLLLALFLFAYILWWISALRIRDSERVFAPSLRHLLLFIIGLTVLQIAFGGFMSGLRAAIHYPSFPDMNGVLVPSSVFFMHPWWLNFLENIATVQFTHRCIGYLLVIFVFIFWYRARAYKQVSVPFRLCVSALPYLVIVQVALGISVLLLSKGGTIPVLFGVLHQAGALLLLNTLLYTIFQFKKNE